jgi:hypothetical protein
MHAYSTEGWTDFLVASAGASAALAGLPARAAQTITILANALAVSLVLLGPGESRVATGVEVLVIGFLGWLAVVVIQARSDGSEDGRSHRRSTILVVQLATLPFIVSGISVLAEVGGGLYWMQAGVVLSMLAGLVNGWVLLIEILR